MTIAAGAMLCFWDMNMAMGIHTEQAEQNCDFLQSNLREFLAGAEGRYALLRDKALIGFFDAPGKADADNLVEA